MTAGRIRDAIAHLAKEVKRAVLGIEAARQALGAAASTIAPA